ncbi:MAG TPA: RNase adapter RapZ [Myxococcaceae bacterium]|nr:RNase adapter RapZ [Myxococcaceae bacterium]
MTSARHIVVITGMSGSGKSTSIHALEDVGFFCIDNLPVVLMPKLTELAAHGEGFPRLALVIDAREGLFLKDAPRYLEEARRGGHRVEVLFLDASDEALIRRFSETRRRHPLAPAGTIEDGIRRERDALADLREIADQVIDTTPLNVHDLKRMVQARFSPEPANKPSISVMSFAYRYGVPPQADLVFDVRFLPNPYFVPELKPHPGTDRRVEEYVLAQQDARTFLDRADDLCSFLLPRYRAEGKSYLTIAVGCTGGRHRSVVIAAALARRLEASGTDVRLWHRDVDKD